MKHFKNYRSFIEQLLSTDDFLLFKKMMVAKNKELEYETLQYMQKNGVVFEDAVLMKQHMEQAKLEYGLELNKKLQNEIQMEESSELPVERLQGEGKNKESSKQE